VRLAVNVGRDGFFKPEHQVLTHYIAFFANRYCSYAALGFSFFEALIDGKW
jgi:hypothetical protein